MMEIAPIIIWAVAAFFLGMAVGTYRAARQVRGANSQLQDAMRRLTRAVENSD